jgi:hypothetical protein
MRYASKLSQADPGQILQQLVHPSVFALLELSSPLPAPERTETDDLLTLIYRGKEGHILFRNDGIRVLIEAFYGERKVLLCALRDRQLDGTEAGSPLTFFPNTDPACNRLPASGFLAAELSIYSWDPNTFLAGLDVEGTVGHFIANPDHYIWKEFDADTFFKLWEQAFFIGRAPWQVARPMSGVATFFVKQAVAFLRNLGYHRIDAVPSWFNVARFLDKLGFKFTYGEHEVTYQAILKGLKGFGSLDSSQQSWLLALQNLPEASIPAALKLPARWPVTHTNMYWVRMHLDLNPFPGPARIGSELTERITALKSAPAEPLEPALHTAHNCPCLHTLGASSPAATSPAATDHAVDATPAPREGNGGDATAAPRPGTSDSTAAPAGGAGKGS